MSRKSQTVRLNNRFGLHMRPASEVARIACAYQAEIHISVADNQANARSIFELLILGGRHGDVLEVSAVGHDAEDALDALSMFLTSYSDPDEVSGAGKRNGHDSFAA